MATSRFGVVDRLASRRRPPRDTTATKAATDATFLFVQSFAGGSLVPVGGDDGAFRLTLKQGSGQTVAFSDRPERFVGAVPTPAFLDGLGFAPENPPNAALVLATAAGAAEVAVLELTNPAYDETTHTATYDATLLANDGALGFTSLATPTDVRAGATELGPVALFIDDCADQWIDCCLEGHVHQREGTTFCNPAPIGELGWLPFCWRASDSCCVPCASGEKDYWGDQCNQTFAACNGVCVGYWMGCW